MKPYQSQINQSTQKGGNTRKKMELPMSKKTKEAPKMVNGMSNSQSPSCGEKHIK
jgi:hypothetical protein